MRSEITVARASLGDFLAANPSFTFDLAEYVLAERYMPAAEVRFRSFLHGLRTGAAMSWNANRAEVERVARRIPAYADIAWSRDDYWETIPFCDKNSLRTRPLDFRDPGADQTRLWRRDTSGTTGPPVAVWFSPEFFVDFQFFAAARAAALFGAWNEDLRKQPVLCAIVVSNKYLSDDRVLVAPGDFTGWTLRIFVDEREKDAFDSVAALCRRHRPAVLSLKPNTLETVVRQMRAPQALPDLRMIISGGADLDPDLRRESERLLGVPICDAYGLSELGGIASECAHREGLHIHESCVIAEVLRDDGCLHRDGYGELVVSSIGNSAMPLLRYRTGDLVDIVSVPCPCGLPGRRIRSLSGRVIHNFTLPDGSDFSPTNLECLFKQFPLREFRATQIAIDRLRIEIEPLPECADPAGLLGSVGLFVQNEMRMPISVDVNLAAFEPGGKFQRYRTAGNPG